MTRASCPSCRLRFTPAAAAILTSCPECGRPLRAAGSTETTLGYRLFVPADPAPALPAAMEIALPPEPDWPDQS
jgi:predicted RNA-binding Zn-ribbon protein involved in translation (DUF1610 family)